MSRTEARQLDAWSDARPGSSAALAQFVRFCMVGFINTFVDLGLYYLLTRSAWLSGFLVLPKAISYILATLCSFTINRFWTFGKRDTPRVAELIRFYATVGLGIFVNIGVLYVAVDSFGVHDMLGALLAAGATAVWGFSFSKWYVFNK